MSSVEKSGRPSLRGAVSGGARLDRRRPTWHLGHGLLSEALERLPVLCTATRRPGRVDTPPVQPEGGGLRTHVIQLRYACKCVCLSSEETSLTRTRWLSETPGTGTRGPACSGQAQPAPSLAADCGTGAHSAQDTWPPQPAAWDPETQGRPWTAPGTGPPPPVLLPSPALRTVCESGPAQPRAVARGRWGLTAWAAPP